MRFRSVALATLSALVMSIVSHAPANAQTYIDVQVAKIAMINLANPTTDVVLEAGAYRGTYRFDWALSTTAGDPVPGISGEETGSLDAGGRTAPLVLSGSGLPDGSYRFRGTLSISDPTHGDLSGWFEGQLYADQTAPAVSRMTPTPRAIYPHLGRTTYPISTKIMVVSPDPHNLNFEIRDQNGNAVAGRSGGTSYGPNSIYLEWNGRSPFGKYLPEGRYTVVAMDGAGNQAAVSTEVFVSGLRLYAKTFSQKVSAAGSLREKFVGKCSQLRRPALRKWKGSLGFYANTKCGRQGWNSSAVSTLHALRLPAAYQYRTVQVVTYGGAAVKRRTSDAYVRYLDDRGRWGADARLKPSVGRHLGPKEDGAGRYVFSDRYFVWGFVVANRSRYDVRDFTVTVTYTVVA